VAIDDPQTLPGSHEVDEGQHESAWLLLLTAGLILGSILLLVFYARLPSFLS
jgi:hypothetical protein